MLSAIIPLAASVALLVNDINIRLKALDFGVCIKPTLTAGD
jgi:hypothetical protein